MLDLTLTLDRTTLAAHRPGTADLVIEVTTARGAAPARAPLAVALVLDVSSSMSGRPLAQVLDATRRILALARPEDAIAIVTFGADAKVLVPLARLDERHRSRALRALTQVGLGHATNIAAGLELGAQVLRDAHREAQRSVLLLSDGEPNVGPTTPTALGELAARERRTGSVTTLGFGARHDDRVLAAIAESGGGSYRFIADPATCGFDLVRAFGAQADIVAREVSLALHPAPGVVVRKVRPRTAVNLPDLVAGDGRLILAELALDAPPLAHTRRDVLRATLTATLVGEATPRRIEAEVRVEIAEQDGPRLREVHRRALRLRAEDARTEARERADVGDFTGAAAITRALIDAIQSAAPLESGEPLHEALEQLVDDEALYARRPDPRAYDAFRRGQRADLGGVDVSAAAAQPRTDQARVVALALAGVTGDAALVFGDGRRVSLPADGVIGRSHGCDVVVPSGMVSRQHARVFALEGDFWVCDLGSSNTLQVNGRLTREPHKLCEGDRLGLGEHVLRFTLRS